MNLVGSHRQKTNKNNKCIKLTIHKAFPYYSNRTKTKQRNTQCNVLLFVKDIVISNSFNIV